MATGAVSIRLPRAIPTCLGPSPDLKCALARSNALRTDFCRFTSALSNWFPPSTEGSPVNNAYGEVASTSTQVSSSKRVAVALEPAFDVHFGVHQDPSMMHSVTPPDWLLELPRFRPGCVTSPGRSMMLADFLLFTILNIRFVDDLDSSADEGAHSGCCMAAFQTR